MILIAVNVIAESTVRLDFIMMDIRRWLRDFPLRSHRAAPVRQCCLANQRRI